MIDLLRETETAAASEEERIFVIINKNSRTFHLDPDCRYLSQMKEENRMELEVKGLDVLSAHGYKPCKGCAKEADE